MKDKFEKWMRKVNNYALGTVSSYSRSIDMLSDHLSKHKGEKINIYEISNYTLLVEIASLYSLVGRFATYGNIGHGTYRNAIAAYVRFYNYYYNATEIEKVKTEESNENSIASLTCQNEDSIEQAYSNKWMGTKKIIINLWKLWFGKKTITNQNIINKKLPIVLIPNDIEQFKKILLTNKKATITTYYKDGKQIKKTWNAENMTSDSNILGNLRSRSEFRKENWQKLNIEKVVVEVNEDLESSMSENYNKYIEYENEKAYESNDKREPEKAYTKFSKQLEHKNAYEKWTSEDDEKLEVLFCEGKSITELSEFFKRNEGAIHARINKLELKEKYD